MADVERRANNVRKQLDARLDHLLEWDGRVLQSRKLEEFDYEKAKWEAQMEKIGTDMDKVREYISFIDIILGRSNDLPIFLPTGTLILHDLDMEVNKDMQEYQVKGH